MSKDHIRYDLLVQNALKGVVRKVLTDASREGLPPEHHFYVSFRTNFSGVKISSRLREKYPEEMTIVLQHQFWDLTVNDNLFEVGLSFSGIPERLTVPFDAISGFYDPSVEFGLKFEVKDDEPADKAGEKDAGGNGASTGETASAPRQFTPRSLRERAAAQDGAEAEAAGDSKGKGDGKGDATAKERAADASANDAPAEASEAASADADASAADKEELETAGAPASGGAQVVSLDAFRKKH
ncbi:SspB family protein [Camelimonas sp. ID_303_24]